MVLYHEATFLDDLADLTRERGHAAARQAAIGTKRKRLPNWVAFIGLLCRERFGTSRGFNFGQKGSSSPPSAAMTGAVSGMDTSKLDVGADVSCAVVTALFAVGSDE